MTNNFLLGVGGTGAKCVEAYLRLATCGVGPAASWVGLLDQDRSNGNSGRTVRALSEYAELRSALRAPGSNDLGASPLLAMALEKPRAGWSWAPEERSSASFSNSVGYPGLPPAEQALADALFSTEERGLDLDEGFRQRPALGAALTLQGVTSSSAVWKDFLNALKSAGHGVDVRVFLVASIFGGTGAAGFPTVARLLRAEIEKQDLGHQVKLGGALLLPYFSFPAPSDGTGPAIRPDSAAFMMQARGALEYYARLQSERVFDSLYIVGNDPLIPLRTYSDGGSTQANPPLLPELVAALAAVDFASGRTASARGMVMAAGAGSGDRVGWEDLPFNGAGGPTALRASIAATLRTAVAWRQLYAPALTGDNWRSSRREAWFRRLLGTDGVAAVSSDGAQRAIKLASDAFEGLLRWFVALNRGGAGGSRMVALVDDGRLAREWASAGIDDLVLLNGLSDKAFAGLVSANLGPTFSDVFARMTYGAVPDGKGVGRVLAALQAACADNGSGNA